MMNRHLSITIFHHFHPPIPSASGVSFVTDPGDNRMAFGITRYRSCHHHRHIFLYGPRVSSSFPTLAVIDSVSPLLDRTCLPHRPSLSLRASAHTGVAIRPQKSPPLCKGGWHREAVTEGLSTPLHRATKGIPKGEAVEMPDSERPCPLPSWAVRKVRETYGSFPATLCILSRR